MTITIPRILATMKELGVELSPTTTPQLWAANLNNQMVQFILLPSQVIIRMDIAPQSLERCNDICSSPLLVSAALIDANPTLTRLENSFPIATDYSDEQLSGLLRSGIDQLFVAKTQLL